MTIAERLRSFIVDELQFDGGRGVLTDDFPLIERRAVDSMGIFHIVTLLEEEFGVEILDEELVPENFGTIGRITALVTSKRGPRPA